MKPKLLFVAVQALARTAGAAEESMIVTQENAGAFSIRATID